MQISFAVTAKLISTFVFTTGIVQFLYFLNRKFPISRHLLCLYSCLVRNHMAGFLMTWHNIDARSNIFLHFRPINCWHQVKNAKKKKKKKKKGIFCINYSPCRVIKIASNRQELSQANVARLSLSCALPLKLFKSTFKSP